jgi:hypothetical protein
MFRLNLRIMFSNSAWVIQCAHDFCVVFCCVGNVFELRRCHVMCRRFFCVVLSCGRATL